MTTGLAIGSWLMHRRRANSAATALLAAAVAGATASSAQSPIEPSLTKAITANTVQLLPEIPPGNLVVRLNGLDVVTSRILPPLLNGSGALNLDIARKNLFKSDKVGLPVNLPAGVRIVFGVHMESWISDVRLRVPVQNDDLSVRFRAAASNRFGLDAAFVFNQASLSFKFHVLTRPMDAGFNTLPAWAQRLAQTQATLSVTINGLNGVLRQTLRRDGNQLLVHSVDDFTMQVSQVAVSDSTPVVEIVDAFLSVGWRELFGLVGISTDPPSNANQAVTRLVNHLLRTDLKLENQIKAPLNAALRDLNVQQYLQQELPIQQLALMSFNPQLKAVAAGDNWLTSEWALGLDIAPDDRAPGLQPRRGIAPTENLNQVPRSGDLQAFVPFTLIEHAVFKLLQAGLLNGVVVPSAQNGGIGNGFKMNLVPTKAPVLRRDETDSNLILDFAVRMENTAIASTRLPNNPVGDLPVRAEPPIDSRLPQTLELSTVDGAADASLVTRLAFDANSGIALQILRLQLNQVSGQLQGGGVSTPLSAQRPLLQTAVNNAIPGRMPPLALVRRVVQVTPPLTILVDAPSVGVASVRLPLRFGL